MSFDARMLTMVLSLSAAVWLMARIWDWSEQTFVAAGFVVVVVISIYGGLTFPETRPKR